MSMSDSEDADSSVPPGIGAPGQLNLIQRRPQPLSVVALVIVAPLILILIIYLVRVLAL
jgi:hypothetical protein